MQLPSSVTSIRCLSATQTARPHYPREMDFQLTTTYKPQGDQPRAISELLSGLKEGDTVILQQ